MYITKARALAAGLTHEGTLYGVPAWFANDAQGEIAMATPKFWPLHAWCWLADKLYDFAMVFVPSHVVVEMPIRVSGPIQP